MHTKLQRMVSSNRLQSPQWESRMFWRGIIIIGSCLICIVLTGQTRVADQTEYVDLLNSSTLVDLNKETAETGLTEEEIYEWEGWSKAELTLRNGKLIKVDSLKLNVVKNRLEVVYKGTDMTLTLTEIDFFQRLDTPEESSVTYKVKHFYFHDQKPIEGVVKQVPVGEYTVLVGHKVDLTEKLVSNPYTINPKAQIVPKLKRLIYIEKGGILTRIKSKKEFKQFFKSDRAVSKLISQKKLSYKDEFDIASALSMAFGAN